MILKGLVAKVFLQNFRNYFLNYVSVQHYAPNYIVEKLFYNCVFPFCTF